MNSCLSFPPAKPAWNIRRNSLLSYREYQPLFNTDLPIGNGFEASFAAERLKSIGKSSALKNHAEDHLLYGQSSK